MISQSDVGLRLKYLLSRYGTLFVVALLLTSTVGFAGAALAYTAPPERDQVTEQTDVQSFGTTLNTSSAVTGNTTLYESDRRLTNMPVYLLGVSPNLTVVARTTGPDDRAVKVSQQITIELYATRDGERFWSETRILANDTRRITDGELRTETTIDVREVRSGRLSEIQSELGTVGVLHAKIHVDTVYRAGKYQGALSVTAPMEITERAYDIDAPQSDERSHATPVTRTVTDAGETVTVGTPVSLNATDAAGFLPNLGSVTLPAASAMQGTFGALALVAALLVFRTYSRLPDPEDVRRAYDESRYDGWISRGQIPLSTSRERVPVESLGDLIDVAIDSDKRVIHDPSQERYAVLDGSILYHYTDAEGKNVGSEYPFGMEPVGRIGENGDE
ncbi:MAG: DUF5305 family protein [Salinirussus sp.]